MVWVFVLVCVIPIIIEFFVVVAIAMGGARVYRAGKRMYFDLKPHLARLNESVSMAQARGTEIARKGEKLSSNLEEISGRWAFIADYWREITAPASRITSLAEKLIFRG